MSMFEDEVKLLIPIMKNYNRSISDEESAKNSTGMFIQYGFLKDLMEKNHHTFSVVTEPIFGRFRFVSVSFSAEYVEWFSLLTQLGFVEKDGCCTFFFSGKIKNKELPVCTDTNSG